MTPKLLVLSIFFLLTSTFAGCAANAPTTNLTTPAPSTTALPTVTLPTTALLGKQLADHDLSQALALAPATTQRVLFTNWAEIKASVGVPTLNSQSPVSDRIAFYKGMDLQWTTFALGSGGFIHTGPTNWSMDATDLLWEATVAMPHLPGLQTASNEVNIFRFPDGFDIARITRHFEEYGFQHTNYQGTQVYTYSANETPPWLELVTSNIFNTAVLPDRQLMILAPHQTHLQAVLDVIHQHAPSLLADASIQATLEHLGSLTTALVQPGGAACLNLHVDSVLARMKHSSSKARKQFEDAFRTQVSTLHPYSAFGFGYQSQSGTPIGIIILQYPQSEMAQQDYELRSTLARDGRSTISRKPYRETMFALEANRVEGATLRLELRPLNNRPGRFLQMITGRDFIFAACP